MTDSLACAQSFSQARRAIEAAITKAAKESGRRDAIELVAVSKRQPDERIEAALASGQRVFGENQVQEARRHWERRREAYPDLRLHLIGPLQSNKAEDAVRLFDVIETVDRPKIAAALASACAKHKRSPEFFVQVNTGEEPQKAGVAPDALPALLAFCRDECGLPITGLMCIPPVGEAPGLHFALLAKLAARHGLPRLSMGMSADFETAVRFGATSVRVGSALFGAREQGAGG